MDLSAAIRDGARVRPPVTGAWFNRRMDGQIGSCVLGAAYEALTGETLTPFDLMTEETAVTEMGAGRRVLRAAFPEVDDGAICPVCGKPGPLLYVLSIHLNDFHAWSREAIADWVEARR